MFFNIKIKDTLNLNTFVIKYARYILMILLIKVKTLFLKLKNM